MAKYINHDSLCNTETYKISDSMTESEIIEALEHKITLIELGEDSSISIELISEILALIQRKNVEIKTLKAPRRDIKMTGSRTLINIENQAGVKTVHYLGYGYNAYEGEDDNPNATCRWIDYTFLYCPLDKALEEGISNWELEHQGDVKQYMECLTEDQLNDLYKAHPHIKESNITADIPYGSYYLIADWEEY